MSSQSSSPSSSKSGSPPPRNSTFATGGFVPGPLGIGPVIVPPPFAPVTFRRMTPQEDMLATLLGIDVLVRQRAQLVQQLVGHHGRLARKNEIGALVQFSREIDRIMK